MILDDIYAMLKSNGLAPTHAAFSTDYLGHSSRYYDYLRCSNAAPSLRSLITLAARLFDKSKSSAFYPSQQIEFGRFAEKLLVRAIRRCR